jgi:hypothetical protein
MSPIDSNRSSFHSDVEHVKRRKLDPQQSPFLSSKFDKFYNSLCHPIPYPICKKFGGIPLDKDNDVALLTDSPPETYYFRPSSQGENMITLVLLNQSMHIRRYRLNLIQNIESNKFYFSIPDDYSLERVLSNWYKSDVENELSKCNPENQDNLFEFSTFFDLTRLTPFPFSDAKIEEKFQNSQRYQLNFLI